MRKFVYNCRHYQRKLYRGYTRQRLLKRLIVVMALLWDVCATARRDWAPFSVLPEIGQFFRPSFDHSAILPLISVG